GMGGPVVWVPSAIGTMWSATAAAEPLDEPPGVRARSCGLRVVPGCRLANSVVTVLPSSTPPARRVSATQAASRLSPRPRWIRVPPSVGEATVSVMSLAPNGPPATCPAAPSAIGYARGGGRALGVEVGPGRPLRLGRGDAIETGAHHSFTRGAAGGDRRGDLARRPFVEWLHVTAPLTRTHRAGPDCRP